MVATKQDILDQIKELKEQAQSASSNANEAASAASEIASYASDAEGSANRAESEADEVLDLLGNLQEEVEALADTDGHEQKALVLSAMIQWANLFSRISDRLQAYEDQESLTESDKNALLNIERIASMIRFTIDGQDAYDRLTIQQRHTGDVNSLLMFTVSPADMVALGLGDLKVRVEVERS